MSNRSRYRLATASGFFPAVPHSGQPRMLAPSFANCSRRLSISFWNSSSDRYKPSVIETAMLSMERFPSPCQFLGSTMFLLAGVESKYAVILRIVPFGSNG